MPIFQDPDRQHFYDLWSEDHPPIRDGERQSGASSWNFHHQTNEKLDTSERGINQTGNGSWLSRDSSDRYASDRRELIHYIKNADTTTWDNRPFGDASAGHYTSIALGQAPETVERAVSNDTPRSDDQELGSPADIQRPRSALHSGDFREGAREEQQQSPQSHLREHDTSPQFPHLGSSPTTPWFAAPAFPSLRFPAAADVPEKSARPPSRSRAPSLGSFSSSYVLKVPTSPLVHQANNTDLDFSSRADPADRHDLLDKASRRRTLPPETFRHLQGSPTAHRGFNFQHDHPTANWNDMSSFQNHYPRRALTSAYSLQLASSVQSPSPRARRPSLASEKPSRPHAPLVGSYEESILRGRMSMNPSKPLDFTAQIGVLGKGKCKANLRCPPHVTVPFPAVFYSYPTSGSGRSISDDNPSPYVGLIDLENSLPRDSSASNKRRRPHQSPASGCSEKTDNLLPLKGNDQDSLRRREKRHRRAESPKSPPGGCYRIPQHGQLQVIIKNPNKTAVKLFLVPYDLSDMEPGTKTFIRQRSYSAGPVIDMPLTARKNYGTDRPEASLNASEDPKDKPILRYLIHLNICCPSKGRFYLHSSIRVVFANRVPDGKEKLRNETQHPEPRYTPYRPARDSNHTHMAARLLMERGSRRPTGHGALAASYPDHPATDGSERALRAPISTRHQPLAVESSDVYSGPRVPHPFQPIPSLREESLPMHDKETIEDRHATYSKLKRGDIGYGGYPFGATGIPEASESLLAKRLRCLEVQKHNSSNAN
ncbi:hypothetical protein BDV25DRAFT_157257 [Aspergillus avenaceus]|uniref:Atos-like conserved domain-containing protein n=1 Tax=Aspergillus avenaceus TaxID=36643 RepID=A0A5N6TRK8_ASPAV|nr:hypothetical protein BDV25DRAFT_157257 [Aspergillus avenaceus]